MKRILLATRSAGKRLELIPLVEAAGFGAVDLDAAGIPEAPFEDAIEAHETFESNARAKARHFFAISGIPTLAEDSGLCVDALGGRPGVRSKRWSGRMDLTGAALDESNNALLLSSLRAIGTGVSRAAAFVCVAAFVDEEGELLARGETRGEILEAPAGNGGFGYDPYFWSAELGRSFAAVTREEKARVSHRARAVRAILESVSARR